MRRAAPRTCARCARRGRWRRRRTPAAPAARANIRAAAARCTWPPERVTPRVPTRVSRPAPSCADVVLQHREMDGLRRRSAARRRPSPIRMFSREALGEEPRRLGGVGAARRRHEGGRVVDRRAVPQRARRPRSASRPTTAFSSVDLPAPTRPVTISTSPRCSDEADVAHALAGGRVQAGEAAHLQPLQPRRRRARARRGRRGGDDRRVRRVVHQRRDPHPGDVGGALAGQQPPQPARRGGRRPDVSGEQGEVADREAPVAHRAGRQQQHQPERRAGDADPEGVEQGDVDAVAHRGACGARRSAPPGDPARWARRRRRGSPARRRTSRRRTR